MTSSFFGTFWSLVPALAAILLALVTKEVYSSLFAGVLVGGLLLSDFGFVGTLQCVFQKGYVACTATSGNVGILIFFVLLGSFVALMGRTGATAAFGRWAATRIRSAAGAQVTTVILGLLVFVDDYFNCLTVGTVMKPVTDAKGVSRAKLAYLIDSTAAPVCIIAPISSWAAVVAGFARDAGETNGFTLFVRSIPYNFYALLTLGMLFAVAVARIDFGPMRRVKPDGLQANGEALSKAGLPPAEGGRVIDLVIPMLVLVCACIGGILHSGGYFGSGETAGNFAKSFAAADATSGLVIGSAVAFVFTVVFYLCRRVLSFRSCMDALPAGFKAMVPAILILCSAWALKGMTDLLGAKQFITDLLNGPAAASRGLFPAVFFLVSAAVAFSTGTSWGTFGILIPICLAAMPAGEMTVIAISACLAGAVCGDHCSPISDTTIMSSASAGCDHMQHVSTQMPYALVCAGAAFAGYLVAPYFLSPWPSLLVSLATLAAELSVIRLATRNAVVPRG